MKLGSHSFKSSSDTSSNELANKYSELNTFLPSRLLRDVICRFRSDIKTRFTTVSFLADAFLLNFCFFSLYFIRTSGLTLSFHYMKLFIAVNLVWLPVSLFTQKFSLNKYQDFISSFSIILKSTVYMTYVLSFAIIIGELTVFSRAHVFGTCFLYVVVQLTAVSLYFLSRGHETFVLGAKGSTSQDVQHGFSVRKLLADILLLTGTFFSLNYFKRGTFTLKNEYETALLIIYGVWFITSLYTGKFSKRRHSNVVHAITPYIKSLVLSVAVLSVTVFLFRLSFYSRMQIFGTFLLLGFWEIVFYFLYSDLPVNERVKDIESIDEASQVFQEETLIEDERFDRSENTIYPIEKELKLRHLKDWPKVLSFLKEFVDLSRIDATESVVLKKDEALDDEAEPIMVKPTEPGVSDSSPRDTIDRMRRIGNHPLQLFINLHRLNDIRRLNRYFLEIHKKLYNNGNFVGRVETIHTHRLKIFSRYPKVIRRIVYCINFLTFRVWPKIPVIKTLYFSLTRGKNRVLSQAEVLGRLYFCGFKVVSAREIDNCLYFIARKIKNPSIDKNPSYGPIIKLPRMGYGGKIIYINKFRTMHPYSEYLQEYIYENFKLNSGGKFKNDFRVTSWGIAFRKLWIDELPQIANFFRGDLALVGGRALSNHYFNLYPKELQDLRTQFYPGLVPPFYADMPKSFDEIIDSEKRYFEQKLKRPFITDVKYFCRAFYNIFFKKARSN